MSLKSKLSAVHGRSKEANGMCSKNPQDRDSGVAQADLLAATLDK